MTCSAEFPRKLRGPTPVRPWQVQASVAVFAL